MKLSLQFTLCSLAIGSTAVSSSSGKQNLLRGLQTTQEKWYVYWQDNTNPNYGKCVSDCTDPALSYCRGGVGQYATVEECCTGTLSYKCPNGGGPCEECTNAPFTPLTPATTKWYVRSTDDKCVRNCELTGGADCGGVNWDSWATKYASMEECCEEGVPWKCNGWDPKVCEECTIGDVSAYATTTTVAATTTDAAPVATAQYYVNWDSEKCVENCEVGAGDACGGIVPGADGHIPPMFDDVQLCCKGSLSYKCPENPEFSTCAACTDADVTQWAPSVTTTDPTGGSRGETTDFYVDTITNKCVQNCDGTSPCGGAVTEPWIQLYPDVQKCCDLRLRWKCPGQETGTCPECTDADVTQWYIAPTTTAATPVNAVATTEYYLDETSGKCVENCEAGTGLACGGIVPPSDTWTTKYADVQLCCQARLSWKCPGQETGTCPECTDADVTQWYIAPTTTATPQYYVDWSTSKCVENCEAGTGLACGGVVPESYTWVQMYDDVRECCQKHLFWKCPGIQSSLDLVCAACTDAVISR